MATTKKGNSSFIVPLIVVVVMVVAAANVGEALEICNMDASRLSGCLPAIRGPSPAPPTQGCCDVIRTSDLHCLCGYKDSSLLPSFGVDPKLAMALPRKCHLNPPPECGGKPIMIY
ncbi:putative lipid-transfer protein DIR1 [Acorus calamus]|uniref:Lipid-transfer protein DIR1 n=1 Tax=Acorus calamus TaxID=4465 RepID=A0AAV9EV83_ACOCL|nr:putative lipid-transfer protein DIR1 [Acorus calamus]